MRPVKSTSPPTDVQVSQRKEVEWRGVGRGGEGGKTKTWPPLGGGLKMSGLLKVTALYICSLNALDTFRRALICLRSLFPLPAQIELSDLECRCAFFRPVII